MGLLCATVYQRRPVRDATRGEFRTDRISFFLRTVRNDRCIQRKNRPTGSPRGGLLLSQRSGQSA